MSQRESTVQNEAHSAEQKAAELHAAELHAAELHAAKSFGSQESQLEHGNRQSSAIAPQLQGDSSIKLRWETGDYNVRAIDGEAFVVECVPMVYQHNPNRQAAVMRGTLTSKHSDFVAIVFRVTGYKDDFVRCEFFQPDEKTQNDIDALVNRELPVATKQRSAAAMSATPEKTKSRKLRYALIAGVGLLSAGLLFGDPGETISVADSFVGAQKFVVETPESGQLAKLFVKVGDRVEAGDVMAKLVKGEDMVKIESIDAKLKMTEKQLEVFERQKQEAESAISQTKQIVQRNLELAERNKQRLAEQVQSAQADLQRVAPLMKSENIGVQEVATLTAAVKSAKADLAIQENKISNLRIALRAADKNAIFTEHGILTPTRDIDNKIELAQAQLTEQTRKRSAIEQIIEMVDIVAPESGVVQAVHLEEGKQHRSSDQAIELALGDRMLLTGFVAPERASSIKPGQSVEVMVPKRKLTLAGKVTSVGQVGRMKIKTLDRRLPTDVAVQVQLEPTDKELRPDEKIDVCVTTKLGKASAVAQWLRNMFKSDGDAT